MKYILLSGLVLCLPLKRLSVTSAYGYRIHPITGCFSFHAGTDLRAAHDTVFAVMAGRVSAAGRHALAGLFVRINHPGFASEYDHLSQVFIARGDFLSAGTAIGLSGATGRVSAEHLHFGILVRGHCTDPLAFLALLLTPYLNQQQDEQQR